MQCIVVNTDTSQLARVQRLSVSGGLSYKRVMYITPFPKAQGPLRKRMRKACKRLRSGRTGVKWYLLDITALLHSWNHSSYACQDKVKPVALAWSGNGFLSPDQQSKSCGEMMHSREGRVVFLQWLAPGRLAMLVWLIPHPGIFGKHYLDSVGY